MIYRKRKEMLIQHQHAAQLRSEEADEAEDANAMRKMRTSMLRHSSGMPMLATFI